MPADNCRTDTPSLNCRNAWRGAIDDALLAAGLNRSRPDETPDAAVQRLVQWTQARTLDPRVSPEAERLARHRVEPVAFMQIGVAGGPHEGVALPRSYLPKRWNPDWWTFEPLAYVRQL